MGRSDLGQAIALNYLTLVLGLADGTGTPLATGQALLKTCLCRPRHLDQVSRAEGVSMRYGQP